MDNGTESSAAAPEWVRALQAALHADMEADNGMSDHLGGSEGASGNADTSLADSALSEKEANNFPNELPASSALAASPAQRQSGSPRPTLRPATPEVLLSGSGADTDAAPRPVIRQEYASSSSASTSSQPPLSPGRTEQPSSKAKEQKKQPGSYGRLILNTKNMETSRFSPKVAISVRDNLGRLFSRDSGEVTLMKKKVGRYVTALQGEIGLVQKSIVVHSQHMAELAVILKDQELQLKRWALGHLFRTFQLQAWLRHSRCEFVVFMVQYILRALQEKSEDANAIFKVLSKRNDLQSIAPSIQPPYDLTTIDNYCLAPEEVLLSESAFVEMQTRLLLLDKLCHRSLHKFRTKLPDLESKSQTERMDYLNSLLMRYSIHMKNSQPLVKNRDRLTWDNYIIWSVKRQNEQTELEKEYFGFVEDERETEGRLFRRWCILMNPKFVENELNILTVPVERERMSSSQQSNSKNSFQGETAFVNPELASLLAAASESTIRQSSISKQHDGTLAHSQKPDMVLSPRTVIAFIRYFSRDVVGKLYKIPVLSELEDALFTLTEQLVFRRIGSVIYRYQKNSKLEIRDSEWRWKCSRCRLMDPVSSYGVDPEFLKNVENPGSVRGSTGDLVLRPSRRRSSSGKRQKRSESGNRSNPSPTHRETTPIPSTFADDISENRREITSPAIPEDSELGVDIESNIFEQDTSCPLNFDNNEGEASINETGVFSGPSFLKRVSAPLGEDLLTLLNTPAKASARVQSVEDAQSRDIVKSLFSPADYSLRATTEIAIAVDNTVVLEKKMSPKADIADVANVSKPFPILVKSMSMESTTSRRDRSGSYLPSVAVHCSGCDACRGRVCRPRLVGDLVAVATPVRYVPTSYPLTQSRPAIMTTSIASSPIVAATSSVSGRMTQHSSTLDGVHPIISAEKTKSIFWHDNLKYAIPFRRTIRLLTQLSSCVCPRDILFTLTWSMKWLHSDALDATGKSEFLGADLMIPLLVMCLIHAKVPCIHLTMQFIRTYGSVDPCGESAYIMTCFEAAVAFIYRLDVPSELKSEAASAYKAYDEQLAAAGLKRNCSRAKLPICSKEDDSDAHQAKLYPISSNGNLSGMVDEDGVLRVSAGHANQDVKEIEEMAMEKLGEWLRDQKAMEDTIGILQQEGWMA